MQPSIQPAELSGDAVDAVTVLHVAGAADVGIVADVAQREALVARLGAEFADASVDDVRNAVFRAERVFVHARIQLYVPLLVEKRARDALTSR
jgi:hypothetical protein